MLAEAWSYFLYFYTFLHQLMVPCSNPEQLLVNSDNWQQYLGRWHFQAAVSRRDADIHKFKALDSVVFTIEDAANDTLVLTGHMRMGDNCLKQIWTYHIQPGSEDLLLEGRPQRRNLLWSGTWAACSDCIIFQEVEPPLRETDSEDSLNRYMLYARQKDVNSNVMTTFFKNSACRNLKESVRLAQEKEFCH
ncbi:apolipoprotein M [Kryptolebias marmoratus]|uniref:apolipoprotein M n=1 Tax=Kryptolebias marmoratus TaxID=37003 RepID=UPI0007F885B6|nr:apolipoprotein M [Kryptolebias marmoratus]